MTCRAVFIAAIFLMSSHTIAQARVCRGALARPDIMQAGDVFAVIALQQAVGYQAVPGVSFDTTEIIRKFRRDAATYIKSKSIDIWQKPQNNAGEALWAASDAALLSCFPNLAAATDQVRAREAELNERLAEEAGERERARRDAIQRREALEAKRRTEEADRQEQARLQQEEVRSKLEEEAKRQEQQNKLEMQPQNLLVRAYGYYIFVKRCYAARQGYLSVFISDIEMEHAKSDVQAISTKIKAGGVAFNDDGAWKQANIFADNGEADRDSCQATLAQLDRVARLADPQGSMTSKDFP